MKTAVKKLKNPLRRRCARELKDDWNKYLVIALFMIVMIGFVSGMYVANGSMEHAEQSRKTDNNLEYGHFVTEDNLDADTIKAIEKARLQHLQRARLVAVLAAAVLAFGHQTRKQMHHAHGQIDFVPPR